jgi:carboxylesterase
METNPLISPLIIPTAEPFFFPGNTTGCLLVHGFTGTPKEMRKLGEFLAQQGYTVLGIRLAGHATQIKDMMRTQWKDWVASVEDGLNFLKFCTDHIYVIGLSMGGVLAFYTAEHYQVKGAICLSTPFSLPKNNIMPFLKLISLVQPEISKGASDWHDNDVAHNHVAYKNYPTICIPELAKLMDETREGLPQIQVPVLMMQSRADHTIPSDSMQNYFDRLGSQKKEMVWVENSGHIITREPDRPIVFDACARFIQRLDGDYEP